jgi:hypothetical protein
LNRLEHPGDRFGVRDVGLDDETIRTARANLRQGLVGRRRILVIVNGDLGTPLGQRKCDPAADATELPVIKACLLLSDIRTSFVVRT